MIQGGVFLYPETVQYPDGKLRLMYECNPLAFIAEQAGGKASTGVIPIMDIEPTYLHQRTALIIGSEMMVDMVERYIHEHIHVESNLV